MEDLLKAYLSRCKPDGSVRVLEAFDHDGHKAAWLEFEGASLGGTGVPVSVRSFHCECYFKQNSVEEDCPQYQAILECRYSELTALFKSRFESGDRAFLPHQIVAIIEELVRMVTAGEFVEPDGCLRLRGVLLRDVTLAKVIGLPVIAATGHLNRYPAPESQEVQDGMLQESY